jgi:hypothetical protein
MIALQGAQVTSRSKSRQELACDGKPGDSLAKFGAALAQRQPPLATPTAAAAAEVIRVATWSELLQAVEAANSSSSWSQSSWTVFELQADVTATSTLNLDPGMTVVGKARLPAAKGTTGRATVKCAAGVQSAFSVKLLQGQR